jgi:hypothetical protein
MMMCQLRDKLRSFCATDCAIGRIFAFALSCNGLALGVRLWGCLAIAATAMRANKWLRACLKVEKSKGLGAYNSRTELNSPFYAITKTNLIRLLGM